MSRLVLPPDEATLLKFLAGNLTHDELEQVAAYLEQHPQLAASLNSLQVNDTLIAALRGAPQETDAPEVAALIARLTAMNGKPPPPATPHPSDFADSSSTHVIPEAQSVPLSEPSFSLDQADQDIRAMLTPPQSSDELGRLGRYRVLRVLGRGGMGAVFAAEDLKLKRKVALKVMLPSLAANKTARQRFVREAETSAKVEHDNIVPIYDIAEDRGIPFLAMPLLIGETLDEPLRGQRPLAASDIMTIGRHMAEGLGAAHTAGLIHRDIKPTNIWLERSAAGVFKRARILDFGLARSVRNEKGEQLTHSGAVMGTPAYMAPEQARGIAIDHRADLFSLGTVLYQMATGRRPFVGDDTFSLLTSLAVDNPPPPHEMNPYCPPGLSMLIMRLLAKNPAERWPQTAPAVAFELGRLASNPGIDGSMTQIAAPSPMMFAQHGGVHAEDVWSEVAGNATELPSDPVVISSESSGSVEMLQQSHAPAKRNHTLLWVAVTLAFVGFALAAVKYGPEAFRNRTDTTAADTPPEVKTPTPHTKPTKVETEKPIAATIPRVFDGDRFDALKADGCIAVSADGKRLAVPVGSAPEVWVYDTATRQLLHKLTGHKERSFRVAFSPDAALLASAGVDGQVIVWELELGKPRHTFQQGESALSVAFHPNGNQIASGGAKQVKLWSLTDKEVKTLAGHASDIHGLAYSPDGNWLGSGSQDGNVFLWNLKTGVIEKTFDKLPDAACGLSFSPDGKLFAFGNQSPSAPFVRVCSVPDGKMILPRDDLAAREQLTAAWTMFTPDSKSLWMGPWKVDRDAVVSRVNLDGKLLARFEYTELQGFVAFGMPTACDVLYVSDSSKGVAVVDPKTGKARGEPTGPNIVTPSQRKALAELLALGAKFDIHAEAGVQWDGSPKFPDAPFVVVSLMLPPTFGDETVEKLRNIPPPIGRLEISGTRLTDKGIAMLASLPSMSQISGFRATGLAMGDRGFGELMNLPRVGGIDISNTEVGDAGLAHVRKRREILASININGTRVTDAGLAVLVDMPALTGLLYSGDRERLTDAGFKHLAKCKRLRIIRVMGPQFTKPALEALSKALPYCKLEYEGGETPPKPLMLFTPEQKIALQAVLDAGGKLEFGNVDDDLAKVAPGEKLVEITTEFVNLDFSAKRDVTEEAFAQLRDLPKVRVLKLSHLLNADTKVEKLVATPWAVSVSEVDLSKSTLTDAGLARLAAFKNLKELKLQNTKVTMEGIAMLKKAIPECKLFSDSDSKE